MNGLGWLRIVLCFLGFAGVAGAQSYRLNGPLAPAQALGGDVFDSAVAPDGSRVVYLADQEIDGKRELFSVSMAGGDPVKISGAIVANGDVESFSISPDGARVVYIADANPVNVLQVYSAPIDGSAPPVRLNASPAAGGNVDSFLFSPDGSRVVFKGDIENDEQFDLYSVNAAGGTATRLNDMIPQGSDGVRGYQISADSSRVVFAFENADHRRELRSAPLDGASPSILLSGVPVSGEVLTFALTPDSNYVVYSANESSGEGLYRVPIDGASTSTFLTSLASAFFFPTLKVSADSSRLLFHLDGPIMSVPIDGSASPVSLTPTGFDNSSRFELSPDSSSVVYRVYEASSGGYELYRSPLDGSSPGSSLSGPLVQNGDVRIGYVYSPDGSRVLYRADQDTDDVVELFSVPADGSGPPVKLSPATSGDVQDGFSFTVDSSRVAFRGDLTILSVQDLYSAPLDGSSAAVQLSSGLGIAQNVLAFEVSSGGDVVYRADRQADQVFELFRTSVTGGPLAKLNAELPPGSGVDGLVDAFQITPDGEAVVFSASTLVPGLFGLHSVPVDRSHGPRRVSGLPFVFQSPTEWRITPGGDRVLYRLDNRLFTAPLDGTSPPLEFGPAQPVFEIGTAFVAFRDFDGAVFAAPVDGTTAPTLIANDAIAVKIAPDDSQLIYYFFDAQSRPVLHSRPVDGSTPAIDITPAGLLLLDFDTLTVVPGSQRVVFSGRINSQECQTFVAPIDGSSPAVALHPPAASSQFEVTSDGEFVVYRTGTVGVYSVPVDGSSPAVPLSVQGLGFILSPDGQRVVFVEQVGFLQSRPVDGSQSAVSLNTEPYDPFGLAFSDSDWMVYRVLVGGDRLFRVPLDGSQPPTLVVEVDTTVVDFQLSPDGQILFFQVRGNIAERHPYWLHFDDPDAWHHVPVGMPTMGIIEDVEFTADSSRLVYINDLLIDGTDELFGLFLEEPRRRAKTPTMETTRRF